MRPGGTGTGNPVAGRDPWRRALDLSSRGFERGGEKAFDNGPYRFRLRIRHLQINLREFGLTISTQVFVTEAAHDLEIPIESRNHQDLFEQLWRLRQRVKGTRLHPARNEIITRPFRRGAGHERGFNFEE